MSADLAFGIPDFVRLSMRPSVPFRGYLAVKSVLDVAVALAILPLLALVALTLTVLNPLFNPGPLLFRQQRLGHRRRPFHMFKFRTMRPGDERGPLDAVEDARITPLGRILRRMRIDELPNFLNVLRGEMSVIGPRPDAADHALIYLQRIPHYCHRFTVKPGITGLAQVVTGYAEGLEATSVKAQYDRLYVQALGPRLDAQIALRTVRVICSGFGAK